MNFASQSHVVQSNLLAGVTTTNEKEKNFAAVSLKISPTTSFAPKTISPPFDGANIYAIVVARRWLRATEGLFN